MKEIKTKQTKKDIKVLDKTTDVTRRAKNAYIRTKERSEQLGQNDDSNYVGWHYWTTLYFLTPVPAYIPTVLP